MRRLRDAIIVGAGPAGSQLAKRYAGRDLDVLVLERSEEVGEPLACSGHVSPDIRDYLTEDDFKQIKQNEIRGARFHSGGKSYRFYKDETVSYVIDRKALDRRKAEQARNTGTEYRLGETVEEVEEREDRVMVSTDRGEYEARVVAGCDGASSTVRDQVKLEEPERFLQGILCFTDEEDSSDFVDVTLEVPDFFGWRIPRTGSVEYGAAVPKGENPTEWLEKVTERFEVEAGERRNICAGAIPIGPPEKVSTERVFLVGDAAAQTKPFTGGGILYGMNAADMAAETVDPENPDTELYEEKWRSELRKEIFLGDLIRRTYSMSPIIQRLGMELFQGKIGVHMDRPSTVLSLEQLKSMTWDRGIKKVPTGNLGKEE